MNLEQYIQELRDFASNVQRNIPEIMVQAANDGLADIETRITSSGQDEFGNVFGHYVEGRYKDYRREKGLEADFVTLQNTNRMWSNISIVAVKTAGFLTTVTIGGQLEETQNKLEWNSDRYETDILALSEQEVADITDTVEKEIEILAKNIL